MITVSYELICILAALLKLEKPKNRIIYHLSGENTNTFLRTNLGG